MHWTQTLHFTSQSFRARTRLKRALLRSGLRGVRTHTLKGTTMTQTIRDLLIDEMQDIYDAEKQLVKALPKMVKAASSEELSQAFADHLEQTKGHVQRLEQAFQLLDQKPKNKACAAMKGLITEAQERIEANDE